MNSILNTMALAAGCRPRLSVALLCLLPCRGQMPLELVRQPLPTSPCPKRFGEQRHSGSPSPLRGGGWGEGLFLRLLAFTPPGFVDVVSAFSTRRDRTRHSARRHRRFFFAIVDHSLALPTIWKLKMYKHWNKSECKASSVEARTASPSVLPGPRAVDSTACCSRPLLRNTTLTTNRPGRT